MNFSARTSINDAASSSRQEEQRTMQQLKALLMRRLTWLVLIAYTLLMCRPVMPVVMDRLAHTFWEQQHLLIVHEVNGKFHVHDELISASHQSEKDKQATGAKYTGGEHMPEQTITRKSLPRGIYFKAHYYPGYLCFLPFFSYDIEIPPPEV